jgi:hypothetical protein
MDKSTIIIGIFPNLLKIIQLRGVQFLFWNRETVPLHPIILFNLKPSIACNCTTP